MKTKTVYSFDPVTREFLGLEVAHESPLEPGEWLIPARATEVEPPAIPAGHLCRWSGTSWTLEARGKPDRTTRDARRDAMRRLARYADAKIEACYAREEELRAYLQSIPDNVVALEAFEPATSWNS